jgi:hypothetical protein
MDIPAGHTEVVDLLLSKILLEAVTWNIPAIINRSFDCKITW